MLYLHRFLRLTPILAVVILITVSILRYASSGPHWPMMVQSLSAPCETYWWTTLLYVQNYAISVENIVSFRAIEIFMV